MDCKGAAAAQTEIPETAFNPFLSHDFLWSLEESGAATGKTGWLAQHLVLDGADGRPAAIMPCYLKSHSMGEYVFDHGWADAYERAGGRLYPKTQASVPVHAGAGTQAPGEAGPETAPPPARSRRGGRGADAPPPSFLAARDLCPPRRNRRLFGALRLPEAHRPAVPFRQRRIPRFRGFPRRTGLAEAQGHPAGAARCVGGRHRGRPVDRPGDH